MLSVRIALRYVFSAKSHGVVNVISAISVAGVAVATAAIVIVLSVFNGFSELTRSRFSAIDPQLMAVPMQGKVFENADELCRQAMEIEGVAQAVPTLSDRGLLITGDNSQIGVIFKGINEDYSQIVDLDQLTEFFPGLYESHFLPRASIAIGVASKLDFHAGMPIELYTLRRIGRINPANPATAFFSKDFAVERILRIDQPEFDADHIIIPLDEARALLQYYNGEASAIEIALKPNANEAKAARQIEERLGLKILTRDQQHGEAFRMIAVEKWVTFAMLIFILVIATFNIISTLSLLAIEKRDNMTTLRYLGATRAMTRNIFAAIGSFITLAGGIIGIALGVCLSLAQQFGGFVKLGGDPSRLTIDAYPIAVDPFDIVAVAALVILVALVASFIAGRLISRR